MISNFYAEYQPSPFKEQDAKIINGHLWYRGQLFSPSFLRQWRNEDLVSFPVIRDGPDLLFSDGSKINVTTYLTKLEKPYADIEEIIKGTVYFNDGTKVTPEVSRLAKVGDFISYPLYINEDDEIVFSFGKSLPLNCIIPVIKCPSFIDEMENDRLRGQSHF
jgi:hypothetical protein